MLETLEKKYILVFGNCDKALKIEHSTENKKKLTIEFPCLPERNV